jgi:poly-gamma-glutamate capsule biosynthesis protein CapA/YwtB (metallophosphatase superfamily)
MRETHSGQEITLFLCGDVMTGRGIDQVLPHPGDPRLHEPYVRDAIRYVDLAEEQNGLIPRPVGFSYIWGDAIDELVRVSPDVRIINLETSITRSDDYWKGKGINYRMNPANIPCLTSAGIDVCALANNHVLDWGYEGLRETLLTLEKAGIKSTGAGPDLQSAEAPAIIEVAEKGRVIVFSCGLESSGIPSSWAAKEKRPGVNLLPDLSDTTVLGIGKLVARAKRQGDIIVVSIHWGGNWGYEISRKQSEFARKLIDKAGADIIHGHSSHHVKGIEVYRDRPIIYGCGDFINDYEGIGGYESFRGDLSLMYFVAISPATGRLSSLRMIPTMMKRFRVIRASRVDAEWLRHTLNREGKHFGTRVEMGEDYSLELRW